MTELESSFVLLSSMSPERVNGKKSKRFNNSPSALSLKRGFRKSAIFDKKPIYDLDSSVIIIDESYEENEKSPKTRIEVRRELTTVSSSSEIANSEVSSEEFNKYKTNVKNSIPQSKVIKDLVENDTYSKIDKWLADNEKVNSYSEILDNVEVKIQNQLNLCISSDSELNENNSEKNVPVKDWNVVCIDTKKGPEELQTPVKNNKESNCDTGRTSISNSKTETDVNSSFDAERETYESILDNLYGKSWRSNQDDILPKSERRPQKPHTEISVPKTDCKPSRIRHNKQRSTKKYPVNVQRRLQNLCDSDTEESDTTSESYKSLTNKRLSFSDSDDESKSNEQSLLTMRVNKKQNFTNNRRRSPRKDRCSSTSSSTSGISFNESDTDSLGTRVRKRLAKKAKELQEVKSLPKDMLRVNKKQNKTDNSTNNNVAQKQIPKNILSKKETTKIVPKSKETNKEQKEIFSFLYSLSDCLPSWQSDPKARFYRDNYKTHKDILLRKLFDIYNEKIFDNAIPKDTPLEWNDRIRQTAGFCYNRRTTKRTGIVERHCRIVLATKILDKASRLRDTLVHEMCHAATWIVNNVADGHGPYWKAWAQKAMTIFPELPPIKRCHDYVINTKYTYKCMDCGYSIGRHSKSLDVERKRCGYCHGKFEVLINKTTKTGETKVTPATPGKINGFALFVKENYNLVKKGDMKHGEVMKLLGKQFSAMKINKKN